MDVKYIGHMGSDARVAGAARISFDMGVETLTERDIKLIRYLAKHRHMSPFEHCVMTVEITCPLFIRSQIMRHRTFAFNEVSRRYTSDDLEFYTPDVWKMQAENNRQASDGPLDSISQWAALSCYNDGIEKAKDEYSNLLAMGVSREQARMVLPQSTYTRFIMTGNLRNWHHFISLRSHKGAQEEAQWIAEEIRMLLSVHFPVSIAALSTAARNDK